MFKVIFSPKNILPVAIAEAGTKNTKDDTSLVPNFVAPIKYIDVPNVVLKMVI